MQGAKARKKAALTGLLQGLAALGISKRRSAVPPAERSAQSWFRQVWADSHSLSACMLNRLNALLSGEHCPAQKALDACWLVRVHWHKLQLVLTGCHCTDAPVLTVFRTLQAVPALDRAPLLLAVGGGTAVPPAALAAAADAWRSADQYYLRSIGRIQRLWEVCNGCRLLVDGLLVGGPCQLWLMILSTVMPCRASAALQTASSRLSAIFRMV